MKKRVEMKMKAFTNKQALELGRAILERFEEYANGKKWNGGKIIIPFQLLCRDRLIVEITIPELIVRLELQNWKRMTLDEWFKAKRKKGDHK